MNNSLMTSQQVVASSLIGENIKVVFDPTGPKADLRNRIMYLRPLPDNLSERDLENVRGDCDHELGHFMHTDVDVKASIDCDVEEILFNAIEDGRVERLVSDKWFGCAENLRRSGDRALRKILKNKDGGDSCRLNRSIIALTLLAFGDSDSKVVKSLGADIEIELDKIRDELASITRLNDSADVLVLARKIVKKWFVSEPSLVGSQTSNDYSDLLTKVKSVSMTRRDVVKSHKFSKRDYYVARTDNDEIVTLSASKGAVENYAEFFDEIKEVAPILRRRILMNYTGAASKNVRHQKKGKVDQRSLSKTACGARNVFIKKLERPSINMDFTLLIDCSGSMVSGVDSPDTLDRLRVAAKCAAVLSHTLDLIGVTNECLGFTTTDSNDIDPIPGYDRVRPLKHIIVKDSRSSYQSKRYNFAELGYYNDVYENIDGEAVLWAANRALMRAPKGANKVIAVFSDGLPASEPEKSSVLDSHLKSVIRRVTDAGFFVIGIGIESSHVEHFYDNYIICEDLKVFAEVFFRAYQEILKKSLK